MVVVLVVVAAAAVAAAAAAVVVVLVLVLVLVLLLVLDIDNIYINLALAFAPSCAYQVKTAQKLINLYDMSSLKPDSIQGVSNGSLIYYYYIRSGKSW